MKNKLWLTIVALLSACSGLFAQQLNVRYVPAFDNINHPQVAYWFFADNMMQEERWKGKIDSFAAYSKYTLIFLTERGNCDFYDVKTMHPLFKKLVAYAHQKGLKIGLQIWKDERKISPENTDRLMQEGEVILDENGRAAYAVTAKNARNMNRLFKSELFKIFAFKKTGDGFYDPATLREITASAIVQADTQRVALTIDAGKGLNGYTAYILTQHYYRYGSNFSAQAKQVILDAFKAYADIPFDGIGLDEYKNLLIAREPVLKAEHDTFRERLYSLAMAEKMKASRQMDLDRTLFDMRYAPQGKPEIRIKAINEYMSLLRTATLDIEKAIYALGKKMYGQKAFIGLHDTFHNNLDRDEVWQTGVSWWNIKRDYGHTDEETPTPIQLGVGMVNPMNAMYNMYYHRSLERIWTKALYDLRFGIRTHYHAANDGTEWGVSVEKPAALAKINPVENAARLLNRFNPRFPAIQLLVVYGMEAIYNWYPNPADRGLYDINDKLAMDKKSMELWNSGYLNVAVPSDVIEDGRLTLDTAGKPTINGYSFDAVIFMGPQYSRKKTRDFFQRYVDKGGKLLIDGKAEYDYEGKKTGDTWKHIYNKAVATSFSPENVQRLGITKNPLTDGVYNGDGAFTFTNTTSLEKDEPAIFSFTYKGDHFSGQYKGLAAVQVDGKGNLLKLAATKLAGVKKNGKEIITMSREADVFIIVQNGKMQATVAADPGTVQLTLNQ